MSPVAPALLDHMAVLGDVTRGRLLLLLERHELTVAELCTVLQAPQSTVSRHLKALADAGWVSARPEATSRRYSGIRPSDPAARRLWHLVREHIGDLSAAAQDGRRLESVLAARRTKSQEFFTASARTWDHLRGELFGTSFHLTALLGLLDPSWTVGDLGCGTGQVAAALAPNVRRVIAVDESMAMLHAARRRLRHLTNVELRRGRLESLPIDDAGLDAVACVLVLHHVSDPERALADVARVLRPGGRLLLADMMPHDRESYRRQMGHVWLGFSEQQIVRLFDRAGFEQWQVRPLAPDPHAHGPSLFAACATRKAAARHPAAPLPLASSAG